MFHRPRTSFGGAFIMSSRARTGQRSPGQEALFSLSEIPQPQPRPVVAPGQADVPDLASYDILLANLSGGKDSQTMLRALVQAAEQAGVRDRVVCVFADLGDEDEWPGTAETAARLLCTRRPVDGMSEFSVVVRWFGHLWTAIRICPATVTKSTPPLSQRVIGFAGRRPASLLRTMPNLARVPTACAKRVASHITAGYGSVHGAFGRSRNRGAAGPDLDGAVMLPEISWSLSGWRLIRARGCRR
jgi:hypothetical protein